MGREILFRGKHVHAFSCNKKLDGSWVYGYLSDKNYINPPELGCERMVDPDTVGQYTGLKDKNGKKIFEGDIVKYKDAQVENKAVVCFGNYEYDLNKNVGFYLHWYYGYCAKYYRKDIGFWCDNRVIEVIGNIHDNPELLEAE